MEDIKLSFWILLCLSATSLVFSQPFDNYLVSYPTICLASGSIMEPHENMENANLNIPKVTPVNVAETKLKRTTLLSS